MFDGGDSEGEGPWGGVFEVEELSYGSDPRRVRNLKRKEGNYQTEDARLVESEARVYSGSTVSRD